MKRFILFFSAALLAGSISLSSLRAEDSKPLGLPEAPSQEAQPSPATPAPGPLGIRTEPLDQPISLIPETLPESQKKNTDALLKETEKKTKKQDFSADSLKMKVRLRQVKNQALMDDRIQAEMETAQAANTDMEKRAAMKRYYNTLFDRMIKIDSSLKPEIELRRKSYLSRYDQTRVRAAGEPSEFDLGNDQ